MRFQPRKQNLKSTNLRASLEDAKMASALPLGRPFLKHTITYTYSHLLEHKIEHKHVAVISMTTSGVAQDCAKIMNIAV